MNGNYCHFNEGKDDNSFTTSLFNKEITLRQNPSNREVGHGAVVWDASIIFAKYMEKNSADYDVRKLKGKSVLELGSGCGLAGIGFMIRGAVVTFTDLDAVVQLLTQRNVNVMLSLLCFCCRYVFFVV
jgi:predicted nicotinamide N-methyase